MTSLWQDARSTLTPSPKQSRLKWTHVRLSHASAPPSAESGGNVTCCERTGCVSPQFRGHKGIGENIMTWQDSALCTQVGPYLWDIAAEDGRTTEAKQAKA